MKEEYNPFDLSTPTPTGYELTNASTTTDKEMEKILTKEDIIKAVQLLRINNKKICHFCGSYLC